MHLDDVLTGRAGSKIGKQALAIHRCFAVDQAERHNSVNPPVSFWMLRMRAM
jgi:hypothetical protein